MCIALSKLIPPNRPVKKKKSPNDAKICLHLEGNKRTEQGLSCSRNVSLLICLASRLFRPDKGLPAASTQSSCCHQENIYTHCKKKKKKKKRESRFVRPSLLHSLITGSKRTGTETEYREAPWLWLLINCWVSQAECNEMKITGFSPATTFGTAF